MPDTKNDRDRRSSPRTPTTIDAFARSTQGAKHPLEISDLSAGGCAVVSSGHPLKPGLAYGLKISGLETLGSVAAWADGRTAGLTFETPLHPAVADHFAQKNPRVLEDSDASAER